MASLSLLAFKRVFLYFNWKFVVALLQAATLTEVEVRKR